MVNKSARTLRRMSSRLRRFSSSSSSPGTALPKSENSTTRGIPASHPGVGSFVSRSEYLKRKGSTQQQASGNQLFIRAGLPFVLFTVGALWVVSSAIDGKLKERAASRREVSLSERQALMEEEHDDMMQRLNKAAKTDFDNTKRIERPEDILARRKAEREKRNAWHRRLWRWVKQEE
ncbi:expressed unknown protein [Seminavis robusta]|uniref:Transmembrane protein n=1 Tax=Seminavis robusta TaxID=568900 RepID=A0A9N8DKX0_9STRA|nr:expressed unknown protein [Seminavis robusta]|eukprot:Sro185_g080430.1 n/a (177) ;mRNA; r:73894-74424